MAFTRRGRSRRWATSSSPSAGSTRRSSVCASASGCWPSATSPIPTCQRRPSSSRSTSGPVASATPSSVARGYLIGAQEKGQPWALARAARCRGLLADAGDIDEPFAEALDQHELTPDAFELARTQLCYGERLRRARRRTEARVQLRAAFTAFGDLGAAPWAERARLELQATGETARRRRPSTLDQLTPQELRIALALADGKTMRAAAADLFLSPKTIEYHLRNAYRKLGIRSRAALRHALDADPAARTATRQRVGV